MNRFFHKSCVVTLLTLLILLGGAGAAFAQDSHTVTVNQNARIDIQITDQGGQNCGTRTTNRRYQLHHQKQAGRRQKSAPTQQMTANWKAPEN